MVEVRISRQSVETLADEGLVGGVTRLGTQVAASAEGAVETQVSRVAIEVLAVEGLVGGATRLGTQVAALSAGAVEAQVSRVAIEVLAAPLAAGAVTRLGTQVMGAPNANTGEVQVSRISGEALARQGSAGPVSPLSLNQDSVIFLHNWATKAEMRTSFRNDVVIAPDTGSESRLGLSIKPFRTLKLEWQLCPGDITLDDLERLEVFFRRMTDERFQVPIYMDQQELDAAYLTSDTTILLDTSRARFFPGARVVIVQLDANHQISSFTFHIIDTMTDVQLTFDSALGVTVPAGSLVMPVMDCEVLLAVEANYLTARVPRVRLTVAEAPGVSQLPALKADLPPNAEQYAEAGQPLRPIWFEEPNWIRGIRKGRSRQGTRSREGRADFVSLDATRSRQTHKFQLQGERDEMWNVLEFFETRRGRLRSFWVIDQDQYFNAADLDASGFFIGVSVIGDLADFSEEMDFIGLVMDDGKVFVRKVVTIQEILTVFRCTLDQAIDLNLDPNDVRRVARARLSRFKLDEFVEKWTHTGLMNVSVEFLEVLAEDDYPTI